MGLAAISTDSVGRSAALRAELNLGFPVLSDHEQQVVRGWGIFDSRFGGIAVPAVFLIDSARQVRFASVDRVAQRVSPAALLGWVRGETDGREAAGGRSRVREKPGDLWRALRLWRRR